MLNFIKNIFTMNTKERIERIEKDLAIVKSELNDDLEVGKWYSHLYGLVFCSNPTEMANYGFWDGEWCDDLIMDGGGVYTNSWTPATEKQVEEALIKEAKKRGFKRGAKFKGINRYGVSSDVIWTETEDFELFTDQEGTILCGGGNCFANGKWAEIIEETKELTVEQISEKLGYNVKVVK